MDPLTAFSLASGVVQLISFAGKLVSAGNDIYQAADGVLQEYRDAEDVAKDLRELSSQVSRCQSGLVSGQNLDQEEERLRSIAENCTSIATDLITRLDKLKVRGKSRRLKSYKQALISVWQRDELEKVANHKEKYQKELDTRILYSLRKRLEDQDVRQTERFQCLDKRTQNLMTAVLDGGDEIDIRLTNQDGVLSQILTGQGTLLDMMNDRAGAVSPVPPCEPGASEERTTALHEAARSCDTLQIRRLLKPDFAPINAKDQHGYTALHFACDSNATKMILADPRIDLNAEDDEGRTALHHAVLKRRPDVIQMLLDAGIDQSLEDYNGRDAAFYAMVYPTAWWMLRYGTSIEAREPGLLNNTGLLRLAWLSDVEGVAYVLKRGAKVDAMNKWNETALTEAARHGDLEVVRLLLSHGANIDHVGDEREWTPLLQAIRDNRVDVVSLLLSRGAKLDLRLKSGNTALAEACSRGHFDLARQLVEAGADVDTPNHEGWTPLISAALHGEAGFADLLLARGANKETRALDGRTPVYLAAQEGHTKVLQILLDRGATAYTKNQPGFTPMSVAAKKRSSFLR